MCSHTTNNHTLYKLSAYVSSIALLSAATVYAGRQYVFFGNMNLIAGGVFGIVQVIVGLATLYSGGLEGDCSVFTKYIVGQLFVGSCCYALMRLAVRIGLATSTLSLSGAALLFSANSIYSIAVLAFIFVAKEKLAPKIYEDWIPKIKGWSDSNKFKSIEYLLKICLLVFKPIVCSLFTTLYMKSVYSFNPALKTSLWPIALFSMIQDVVATCLTSYLDKKQIFSRNIHTNFIISHIVTGIALYSLLGVAAQAGALASTSAAITIGSTLAIGFGVTKMTVSLIRKLYFNEAKHLEYSIRQDSKY